MQTKNILIILVAIVVLVIFFPKDSLPVLSRQYGLGNQYYLYVPGTNSSCTWTFNDEKGKLSSLSTYPRTETGEHSLIYKLQDSSFTNMQVVCLDSNGKKYTGVFK